MEADDDDDFDDDGVSNGLITLLWGSCSLALVFPLVLETASPKKNGGFQIINVPVTPLKLWVSNTE